jgi:hypothetical protein
MSYALVGFVTCICFAPLHTQVQSLFHCFVFCVPGLHWLWTPIMPVFYAGGGMCQGLSYALVVVLLLGLHLVNCRWGSS